MKEHDSVSIDDSILQDNSYKSRHFIFKRIISDKETGRVQHLDTIISEEQNSNSFWVKFHIASIRINEKYLIKEKA
jgi:hypothetical protein